MTNHKEIKSDSTDNAPTSEFDLLSKEEWESNVRIHVHNLDRAVVWAMRKAVRDYVLCTFSGAFGTELSFIGDVVTAFQAHCSEKDLSEELHRSKLFGPNVFS